jgi:hypothetical protein
MAAEVNKLIQKHSNICLNLSANHIHCFCHKVALILNSGLTALAISKTGLTKSKNKTLGSVPALASIEEESEEIEQENNQEGCSLADKEEVVSDPYENNDQLDPNNDNSNVLPPTQNSSRIYVILKKASLSFCPPHPRLLC